MKKVILIITLALFLTTVIGCIGIKGGSDQGRTEPTLGQQLIDLKKAREDAAITVEEYKELKKKLVFYYE
jgi:hypothetical protein